jgi:hypothetical protein
LWWDKVVCSSGDIHRLGEIVCPFKKVPLGAWYRCALVVHITGQSVIRLIIVVLIGGCSRSAVVVRRFVFGMSIFGRLDGDNDAVLLALPLFP